MCFVFIWEQTATCGTYGINWLVFITEMKSVYSAVRTGSLNKAVCPSSVKGLILCGQSQAVLAVATVLKMVRVHYEHKKVIDNNLFIDVQSSNPVQSDETRMWIMSLKGLYLSGPSWMPGPPQYEADVSTNTCPHSVLYTIQAVPKPVNKLQTYL